MPCLHHELITAWRARVDGHDGHVCLCVCVMGGWLLEDFSFFTFFFFFVDCLGAGWTGGTATTVKKLYWQGGVHGWISYLSAVGGFTCLINYYSMQPASRENQAGMYMCKAGR